MSFSPEIAERRFGYGLSPVVAPPRGVDEMLARLAGPDVMRAAIPFEPFSDLQARDTTFMRFRSHYRQNKGTEAGEASLRKSRELVRQARQDHGRRFTLMQARRAGTPDAFRERLAAFWGDHFAARGRRSVMVWGGALYVEEAIRPRMTGSFADMLIAVVTHPMMIDYLDQQSSVGPNSRFARRRPGRGLNENLAREVIELHTLGVGAPYSQGDVRALAHLLTGLGYGRAYSFVFRRGRAEPGAQTVLGRTYAAEPRLARIHAVLRDLAAHPATAAHIARKLAVHFISDTPPNNLIAAMTEAYLDTGGDLMAVYAALLRHPAAWALPHTNVRPPEEFISASLRALAVTPEDFARLSDKEREGLFLRPLRRMGQAWTHPEGPDGWAEEDAAWISPQGLAGRMEWAMTVPKQLLPRLPDPRKLVHDALGAGAPQNVVFAAGAAESEAEAIGLILMSPAFQRR